MRLVPWPDVDGFLGRAEGFLTADEARHHLTFGLALALQERKPLNVAPDTPWFATIEVDGRVVATGLRAGVNLILSPEAGTELVDSPVLDAL